MSLIRRNRKEAARYIIAVVDVVVNINGSRGLGIAWHGNFFFLGRHLIDTHCWNLLTG